MHKVIIRVLYIHTCHTVQVSQLLTHLTDIVRCGLCDFTEVDGAPGEDVACRALKRGAHRPKRVEHDDPLAGRETEAHHIAPVAPRPFDKCLVTVVI